jgi:hypothetical protein
MPKNKVANRRKPPTFGYKPERPVVSVRFDPTIFADLKAEANALGVTITDVVHRRLRGYEEWLRRAKGDEEWLTPRERITRALVDQSLIQQGFDPQGLREAAWQQIEQKSVEADLRRLGFTRIDSPGGGLWAEPGANIPSSIVKTLQEPPLSKRATNDEDSG